MEINYTLFIQLAIFIYVLVVLKYLFFDPILKILQKRDELTLGRIDAAEDYRLKMDGLKEKLDREVGQLRTSLEEQRHEATKRQREISEKKVQDAKHRVEKQLIEKRALLEQETEKMRSKVPQLGESVAKEIVDAMLGSRVVRP